MLGESEDISDGPSLGPRLIVGPSLLTIEGLLLGCREVAEVGRSDS
jgi:hypothetical protein